MLHDLRQINKVARNQLCGNNFDREKQNKDSKAGSEDFKVMAKYQRFLPDRNQKEQLQHSSAQLT